MVHLTELPHKNFRENLETIGFEIGAPWQEGDFLQDTPSFIEWGRINDLSQGYIERNSLKEEESRYLNSKINQREWKQESTLSPLKSTLINSEEQLIDALNHMESPVVLKGEFGLAGRNHIVIENQTQGWKLQQIPKKLFGYPIFAEEWVGKQRTLDFSTLWDFSETGPFFLGSTEMILDEDGSFRGIRMSAKKELQLTSILPNCLETIKTVYDLALFKPIGPAAMDGFFFNRDGEIKVQVFSEINFRYSMGRILYEIRKRRNVRVLESGILFLPLTKIKPFDELKWIHFLKKETQGEFFFVTPIQDLRGKYFQNVGLYFEAPETSIQEEALLQWILEDWRAKVSV